MPRRPATLRLCAGPRPRDAIATAALIEWIIVKLASPRSLRERLIEIAYLVPGSVVL